MQSLAICIYGAPESANTPRSNLVDILTRLFLGHYQLDIFHDYSSANCMQSLYNACWKKTCNEVVMNRQYDRCMAVYTITDLIPFVAAPLEQDEKLYYFRGSFSPGVGNTVSPELFYCGSTDFNRACEYYRWTPPDTMMPWTSELIHEPVLNYNFAYFLRSWKIKLQCLTAHNPELFRKYNYVG